MFKPSRSGSIAGLLAAGGFAVALSVPADAATLDAVKERGRLLCGVNPGLLGFAEPDATGKWSGFDVDFCRAVAAAVFADPQKVEFVPLSASERFDALASGKIDLLSRNSTWTISRETDLGLTFAAISYFDGQGFLVESSSGKTSALELSGSKVCVQGDTTSVANLADYFSANNMTYEQVVTASPAESLAAFSDGRCTAITSDMSQLYAERLNLADPGSTIILPDAISKEPLGPVVRQDDPKWATLVKWVYFALLDAEELGVGAETLDAALASKKPEVRRLVGLDGGFGAQMGVANDWVVAIIRAVGNYGEIYDRNLGEGSKLGIPRGMNQLWDRGGLQYAPPFR